MSIKTTPISLYPHDALHLLQQYEEHPDVFIIESKNHNSVVLEHSIDGTPTTLNIHLRADGTWSATKHIEV